MAVKTFRSEEARNRFRDVMESVIAGDEVVVERYNRPAAVVISYSQWQDITQLRKRLKELEMLNEVRRIRKGIASGEIGTISHDELKRQVLARRAHVGA